MLTRWPAVVAVLGMSAVVLWIGMRGDESAVASPARGTSSASARGEPVVASGRANERDPTSANTAASGAEGAAGEGAQPRSEPGRSALPPPVGAEGYGPHIERAAMQGTPGELMQALDWIASCRHADEHVETLERARGRVKVPPQALAQLLELTLREQRRCQTVTPRLLASELGLAQQALDVGAFGAGHAYVRADRYRLPSQELRDAVVQALRRDARAGHQASLDYLVGLGPELGLSDLERRTYQLVAKAKDDRRGDGNPWAEASMKELPGRRPGLSEGEEAQAQAAANEILQRCCQVSLPAPKPGQGGN